MVRLLKALEIGVPGVINEDMLEKLIFSLLAGLQLCRMLEGAACCSTGEERYGLHGIRGISHQI